MNSLLGVSMQTHSSNNDGFISMKILRLNLRALRYRLNGNPGRPLVYRTNGKYQLPQEYGEAVCQAENCSAKQYLSLSLNTKL